MEILRLHEARWDDLYVTTILGLRIARVNEGTEAMEAAIRESAWFQENEQYLQWSEETFEWCLVFPCGEFEDHRKCE
jgi:hypothetical protein